MSNEPEVISIADRALLGLNREGWSAGDAAFAGPDGRSWIVYAARGEQPIRSEGATRDEAWSRAADQALAGRPREVDDPPA
jgi:hypothetical protein